MNKSIKKNYIYNVIYQVFQLIVPLLITPYISRVLSADGIGKYSFSYSLITYFTIFAALGFNTYAQREIAKYQGDINKQTKVFWEINISRLMSVGLALLVNVILCATKVYKDYNTLMLIMNLNIVAIAFDIAFFFQGNEEFGKIVLFNVIVKSIGFASIFIFVKKEDGVWVYTLIMGLMLLLANMSLWLYLPKRLVKVSLKELNPLSQLKGTIILFIPTIAISIYTVLDRTLIGVLITDTYTETIDGIEVVKKYSDLENGYYEQSEKLVKMAMTLITCIGTVMIPRNSREFEKGNIEGVKENVYTASRFVWFIGIPLSLGIAAVASNLVPWYYGEGYEKCTTLLQVFSALVIIIGFSNVFGLQYMVPCGKDKKYAGALLLGALVNLILNLIFIRLWWSVGAAIASIIAEFSVTLTMIIMCRKEISILRILKSSVKYLISGLTMFGVVFGISFLLKSSILNTFLLVLLGIVVYFVMLLVLHDKLLYGIIHKVFKKKNNEINKEGE